MKIKYMKPLGYINPTALIGREDTDPTNGDSRCDNPFHGDKKQFAAGMLCRSDDLKRSEFNSPFYLALGRNEDEPYVLDACAGPHVGTEKFSKYIGALIDP
ncbi:hypothetical protein OEA41_010088 [Lepraria neglecta]|uniref:Uncharacterized protein n=1 Tax=Lepraria neglecta TaxID=209136 RepID=A0AAE0DHE2_9LECA|nr:hypothetical protein OEA41_010088 [Lepraria neglecta]